MVPDEPFAFEDETDVVDAVGDDVPALKYWLLWAAGAAVTLSVLLFAFGSSLPWNLVGWLLGSVVAFLLVGIFWTGAREREDAYGRGMTRGAERACRVLPVLALLPVAVHAYLIAAHFA